MSEFECKNCDLGLTFQSKEELKNHQNKFCTNYNDVSKLDARLSGLKRPDPADVKYGIGDIKDFLKGKSDLKQPLSYDEQQQLSYNERYNQIPKSNRQPQNYAQNQYSSDLENQVNSYKENKQSINMYKNQTEQDMVELLGDLQRKKEIELRAQIEKEEISRAIKTTNRSQLDNMEKQKKFELEKLSKDRESVQIREQNLLEQIKNLESDLINKESQNMRLNNPKLQQNVDNENRRVRMNDALQKESEFAEDRAAQVAKIKLERERLEQDRQRIQAQLKIIQQKQDPKTGFRENTAAKRTGSAVTSQSNLNQKSYQRLEPSLKDKLVDDQMKINYLREEHQKSRAILNNPNEFEEADILQRELGKQQNLYHGLQKLTDEFADRNYPKKDELLGDIRRTLERESAAPQSVPQRQLPQKLEGGQSETPQKNKFQLKKQQENLEQNKNKESNLLTKLDDLENLIIKKSKQTNSQKPPKPQQGQLYNSMQQTPQFPSMVPQQQSQNYMPAGNFMQPQYPLHQSIQPQEMKQFYPQYQNPYQYPPQYQPPQMYQPQQPDPSLAYFAQFLQSQEEENRKLRDALQNFGKNTNTVDEINNSINNATMEIQKIKNDPTQSVKGMTDQIFGGPKILNDNSLPDEFLFHQNELRCKDLEIEERALMNLQAQEYDQLLILQKLSKDSELYEYKLKQYKELSALRAEAEKVLQEQRIDKIKYDYEIQKAEQARSLLHQQWLEQQKKMILEGRIGGVPQMPQQNYPNQLQFQGNLPTVTDVSEDIYENKKQVRRQTKQEEFKQMTKQKFDTWEQVVLQIDYLYNLPKNIQKVKIVSIPFKNEQQTDEPQDIGPSVCEPALDDKQLNQVNFETQKLYQNVPIGDSRIIFELQAFDPSTNQELFTIGWTWIDLQEQFQSKLRTGKWSLPIYLGETNPQIAALNGEKPKILKGVVFGVRVGLPEDKIFNSQSNIRVDLNESPVPREHSASTSQILPIQQNSPNKRMNTSLKKPESGFDPTYNNQGVKIRVHYCLTQKDYSKVTVRCTLQSQDEIIIIQNDGQGCQYKNTSAENVKLSPMQIGQIVGVDQLTNLVSVFNKNQTAKLKLMNFGAICKINGFMRPFDSFEFIWTKDLHKYFWDSQGMKPIFLLVELFGKPSKNEERQILGYSVMEILTKKDGKLKTGFFDIKLNNPPITFDYNQQIEIEGEHIGITIMDPNQINVNKANIVEDNEVQAEDYQRPDTGTLSEQFHPNFDKQYTFSDGWTDNDALDIYIDGARHLPDNTSITKINVKIVNFNLKEQIKPKTNIAVLEKSTLRNQQYIMKFELRSKDRLMPTSLAYIIVETIDKSSMQSRYLGFSYFPLFMDSRDQMPAATDNIQQQNLVPHTGLFQMPIFSNKPNEEIPFTYERFVYLDRVPTASILIRVVKAQKDQSGKPINASSFPPEQQFNYFQQPPDYSEGLYSTQYYTMTEEEKKIMLVRRKRQNPKLEKVTDELIRALKKDPDLMLPSQKLEFVFNAIKCEKQTPMLDYNYFSEYDSGLGIRVNIEAIHNNKTKGFPLVMASVIPPASYYDSDRKSQKFRPKDSFLFIEPDFESHYITPKFSEGDALLIGFEPQQPGMSLFLDIKMYMPDQNKIIDYGFGLCPLIETVINENLNTYFVISGLFSIPVYKGSVNKIFLNKLKQQIQPQQFLKQSLQKKEIQLLNDTSIIVRVVDTQRKMQFLKSFEKYQNTISTRYLDQALHKSHKYEQITGGFFGPPAKLKEILPKDWKNSSNMQGFNQILENSFKEYMNI